MAESPSALHIDFEHLSLQTESDVEQKLLMPLLLGAAYLAVPLTCPPETSPLKM